MVLNESVKQEVKKKLSDLKEDVRLIVFTQKIECQFCEENRELVEEIAELSGKISTEVYNFAIDKEKAEEYGIDKIPAIAVVGEKDYGIRFYGIPGGYELTSLLEAIRLVSTGETQLSEETKVSLDSLEKDVHLQVFVTPT